MPHPIRGSHNEQPAFFDSIGQLQTQSFRAKRSSFGRLACIRLRHGLHLRLDNVVADFATHLGADSRREAVVEAGPNAGDRKSVV